MILVKNNFDLNNLKIRFEKQKPKNMNGLIIIDQDLLEEFCLICKNQQITDFKAVPFSDSNAFAFIDELIDCENPMVIELGDSINQSQLFTLGEKYGILKERIHPTILFDEQGDELFYPEEI